MKIGNKKYTEKVRAFAARVLLIAVACVGMAFTAAAEDTTTNRLQNGSFEEGQTFEKYYDQPSVVPSWKTTAFQGKFELFRDNPNTYLTNPNVRLTPTHGVYAAELNADEESTLYQIVKTTPSSLYEWGLDHGARNGTDIMALIIGPNQSVKPSKPSKEGRDHFMQMIDWLNSDKNPEYKAQISGIESGKPPQKYTVFSKKFADKGTFEDNAGNNAFSLTPSTIYTEEWHIWIMASNRGKITTEPNPWNHYGSNAEGSAGSSTGQGSTAVDLSKYYLYTVPAGQKETLFGFVSVGFLKPATSADKAKTYGNFLDGINFEIYHPLSGSTTTHGSAVIGGSDGTTEGEGSSDGHKVTVGDKLATYVIDGQQLRIQAIVKSDDKEAGCEFVGIYYTSQDENGNPVNHFLKLAGNELADTGSLTDEQKKGKWIKSTNTNGDTVYTYYLENISSPTDLHFVFIKNPTVTYDSNGGKAYTVEREYNTGEASNVYSFKPATGVAGAGAETGTMFIPPYVSRAAEGQNDGWKFLGWKLTGDTVESKRTDTDKVNEGQLGSLILPAEHTIACDYSTDEASSESAAQYFKIYDGNVTLTKNIIKNAINEDVGVTWTDHGEIKKYANVHKGLTMVAQWRWRQAFIPQNGSGNSFTDSDQGGTVEIISVTDKSDANYNAAYGAYGGKSYHAETDETITVTAIAKENYTFEGWYDESGNLVTTNATYTYTETKESVKTYYARFSSSVTQTYIRQVKNGDAWEATTNDAIGTLGRYSYTDAIGMPISSTAAAAAGYKFVGWYDAEGNKVAESMLINNGATISYTTTGNATYYARFEVAYTVKFAAQTKQANGSFKTDTVGGKVSATSVSDVDGAAASSKATANSGYKFLGWYDKDGNLLSSDATYSTTTTAATNGVTYYARFESIYNTTVSRAYTSFVAESRETQIPSAFGTRDAGTGKNAKGYGLDNKYGNTISTGFTYSIDNMTNVKTIQITVTVPSNAYVKVRAGSGFTGGGAPILTDGDSVIYNKGSIRQISGATTLTYYWDASGLEAGKKYGFIIDNLYAPGAKATITVNGTGGTKVTSDNGVVNTPSEQYRCKSHYNPE